MFIRTTAINKIRKLHKFVKGVQGGSSAGKTYAILPILIDIATKNPFSELSVVAESIPHLKRGAMKDFKKIMVLTQRWFDGRWNATDFKYTFGNGSVIEFFSADNDAKLRGARRDWLYMNECNNMNFNAYTELASRTKKGVYLDWNPTNEFWFHTDLNGDTDVDFVILNYSDNEACPESALNFILKAKEKAEQGNTFWINWYKVYGLGQIGNLQGVVIDNWQQCDDIPMDAKLVAYGTDFGFTNDPTTLIAVYKQEGKLWVDELLYRTNMTNSDIGNYYKTQNIGRAEIVCDSAEPKSIEELRRQGFNVHPAMKGPDSIKIGIDILKRYDIMVTKRSTNLIKELRSYLWETDRDGKLTGKPIDHNNHAIDALRYIGLNKLNNRPAGKYATIGIS
jgi:phage terminase large subunit